MSIRYIAFSGGVGGAKLALGLARVVPLDELLIVCNTGDDFEHLGLRICPDLDTVTYTLAGRADRVQGWGIEGETWHCLESLAELGGPSWFRLGDRDLATHLYRTQRLREGARLGDVTAELCRALGIASRIVPVSDDPTATMVATLEGELPFQDYFVRRHCAPPVTGFRFAGAQDARIHPELAAALASPELRAVIFCPSNPFVSIGPMLAIAGMKEALKATGKPVIAVSPIIGGQAVKGPAAKMMAELGMPTTALAVARHYRGIVDALVIDEVDREHLGPIHDLGIACTTAPTLMNNDADKVQLASTLLEYADALLR
ncbi:2-phospho-L-lactate transferase [Pseudomonas sp. NFACC07-1]|uniref:2-phospho-L-lactate transferase n=1 Tax=Pseudomonas sp. NFACC07-1 TaxID=1566239 RepID=UPI0008D8C8FB|nr:2-phospho-L-lactate transferase [Pseudomonas sp. NFACC07-1]SEI53859.1 LPPG:FO 2-phospho-L-lactate transferase [Pseudomonas sp. NFACC07-1]